MNRKHRLQLQINPGGDQPAYRQIAGQLKTFIIEGLLEAGDALPPVRKLALELGVHFNTVAEAYRTLAAEGFLEITHGHGVRICDRAMPKRPDPTAMDQFRLRLRELIAGMRARGLTQRQIKQELKMLMEALDNR